MLRDCNAGWFAEQCSLTGELSASGRHRASSSGTTHARSQVHTGHVERRCRPTGSLLHAPLRRTRPIGNLEQRLTVILDRLSQRLGIAHQRPHPSAPHVAQFLVGDGIDAERLSAQARTQPPVSLIRPSAARTMDARLGRRVFTGLVAGEKPIRRGRSPARHTPTQMPAADPPVGPELVEGPLCRWGGRMLV